jgi:CheY-like chemotaxis protein
MEQLAGAEMQRGLQTCPCDTAPRMGRAPQNYYHYRNSEIPDNRRDCDRDPAVTVSLPTPHLLIADDDSAFRLSLSQAFESRGFRTSQAADGLEALHVVRREEIHLILLDLQMPRLSGLETMRRLRGEFGELPWILVSGALDEQVIAQAESMSVYSVLAKPFRVQEASGVVISALRDVYRWDWRG